MQGFSAFSQRRHAVAAASPSRQAACSPSSSSAGPIDEACCSSSTAQPVTNLSVRLIRTVCAATAAVCLVFGLPSVAHAQEPDIDTFENVPGQLRSDGAAAIRLGSLFGGAKRKEVEACTRTCLPACMRGGEGAPGLGPITLRKEAIVFKDGFRTRTYCLSECAQVCSLSINGPPAEAAK